MATLYVMEQGCKLRKVGLRVRVEKEGEQLAEFPLIKVDRVVIYGNVSITTPLMSYLLREGLPASFLDVRGRAKGELRALFSPAGELRKSQYCLTLDRERQLYLCSSIVRAKIRNQRTLLQRYVRRSGRIEPDGALDYLLRSADEASGAMSLEELRGLEGRSTAVYFRALRRFVPDSLEFYGRNRRPPKDPMNAMLSLGYSLLLVNVMGAIESEGLDPYIGYLHSDRYGKPSLALDLMEEWRPLVVDSLVLSLVNRKVLDRDDFIEEEGSVLFKDHAARKFISQYNGYLYHRFKHPDRKEPVTLLEALQLQVKRFCSFLRHGTPYEPFMTR